jgi:hypothetical protein
MKPWETKIPKTPSNKDRRRCYTVWTMLKGKTRSIRIGGKVVWLTDKQLTLARIKHTNKEFEEVLERDLLEEYKKYLDATLD